MKFFRLKPECYLVCGKKRAVIYNLLEEKSMWLTKEATELIKQAELNQPISGQDMDFFQLLEKEEWGIFSDKKIFIDKFRPYNVFNEKKFHKNSPMLEIAVLQLENACNLNCEFCNDFYCPVCLRKHGKKEKLTYSEWIQVIDKLIFYGLKTAILTGGEVALYSDIQKIITYLKQKQIFITIQTNGLKKIKNLDKKTSVVISVFSDKDVGVISKNYNEFDNVTLLVYDKVIIDTSKINKKWKITNCKTSQDVICKERLGKTNVIKFHARRTFDNCLKNKIAISYDGDIYPCFEVKQPVGNFKVDQFHEVVKKIIENYWVKSVDKREGKCGQCEFRYLCNSCNMFDINKFCKYDVEEGVWK